MFIGQHYTCVCVKINLMCNEHIYRLKHVFSDKAVNILKPISSFNRFNKVFNVPDFQLHTHSRGKGAMNDTINFGSERKHWVQLLTVFWL